MRDWLVCRSLPAMVPLLVARAAEAGADAYFPRIPVLKRIGRQRRHGVIHIPAYPGYFFLAVSGYSFLPQQDRDKFKILKDGDRSPVTISDEIIQSVKSDESSWEDQLPQKTKQRPELGFVVGDEVRITSGLFTKRLGVVISISDNLSEIRVGGLTLRINHFLLEPKHGRKETA